MPLSAKTLRKQLALLKPLITGLPLKATRLGQDKIGELMELKYREHVLHRLHSFRGFDGGWVMPKDRRREGVILYLHGGGYTCGDLDYALGFGSMLSAQTGTRVFCCAYRLAPEHPFPAALEDALEAYQYLLSKGYPSNHILLSGESAGGGLCYSLCLKLKALGLPLPCGILAISPWTDLTASGDSYEENREVDPSMSRELLEFFAGCYTDQPANPLVSPIFGDLTDLPPSLIFVGGDEIMRSDSQLLHNRLLECGCKSKLIVAPERWHGYLLYGLSEDKKDFETIGKFLDQYLSRENKLNWLPLDNAAKIYPAARRENWSNVYRLSVTLTEEIHRDIMKIALDITVRRFPSMAVRLRRGVFWYYLQQLSQPPEILEENSYPLVRMSRNETRSCALRVILYRNRLAIEIFHSLTDGNGALIFLKSLLAEYLHQRHGLQIPAERGVLGRLENPSLDELEDSFQKYAGPISASRREDNAWHLSGTPEPGGFLHLTCFQLSVQAALEKAHQYRVSLTCFLCAVTMLALQNMQKEQIRDPRRRKPIKVLIPVNLRRLFTSKTLRNFAMYTTPEIQPQLGEYSFPEICKAVHAMMELEINAKQMSAKIAANVSSEKLLAVRLMPLFIKDLVMKAVFNSVGERKSCLSMSNLGVVELPEVMAPFVERFDFILGAQATAPYNCGILSWQDTLYINFIRNIRESTLEYHFFKALQELGLTVLVQSNEIGE